MFDHFEIDGKGLMALAGNLETAAKYSQRGMKSALSSEGYRLRELIKSYIRWGGSPYAPGIKGAGRWPTLNIMTSIIAINTSKKYKKKVEDGTWKKKRTRLFHIANSKRKRIPFQKMAGDKILRYTYVANEGNKRAAGTVRIGFINSTNKDGEITELEKIMYYQAKGQKTLIKRRMRRYFYAVGIKLKKGKRYIEAKPRPLIEPIIITEEANIRKNLDKKYVNNLIRYMTGAPKDMGDVF